jgi:3-hydroxymyristoyl/3-hydroxydecanoyl-(acyl carrier protein) dehydratase
MSFPKPTDLIAHREPFIFVDEITELTPGVSATTTWKLTGEEWFFAGHFPGRPTLPGVLMCEAIAQTGALASYRCLADWMALVFVDRLYRATHWCSQQPSVECLLVQAKDRASQP